MNYNYPTSHLPAWSMTSCVCVANLANKTEQSFDPFFVFDSLHSDAGVKHSTSEPLCSLLIFLSVATKMYVASQLLRFDITCITWKNV